MTYDLREFRSTRERCEGRGRVGDVVGYSDIMNGWEAHEVVSVSGESYRLLNLEDGTTHHSDLRQYGWTFGTER